MFVFKCACIDDTYLDSQVENFRPFYLNPGVRHKSFPVILCWPHQKEQKIFFLFLSFSIEKLYKKQDLLKLFEILFKTNRQHKVSLSFSIILAPKTQI